MIVRKKNDFLSDKDKIEFWARRKAAALSHKKVDAVRVMRDRQNGVSNVFKIDLPEFVENAPVYILLRTSGRPEFFRRCYESILEQTYPNIVTVVHTDDPRDTYVQGDIIIRGHAYHPKTGTAPYNLYNNRLLAAVPRNAWGWFHFIDDDDMYHDKNVIANLVKHADPEKINVARVKRWGNTVFPRAWGRQNSYQTECFFLHSVHAGLGSWWANKGGDHYYSRQITAKLKINWIEGVYICKAQDGKGHGRKLDLGGARVDPIPIDGDVDVLIITERAPELGKIGSIKRMPYAEAAKLEKQQKVKITFSGVTVIDTRVNKNQDVENEITGDRTGEETTGAAGGCGVGDDAESDTGAVSLGDDQPQFGGDTVADTGRDISDSVYEPCVGAHTMVQDCGCAPGDQEDFITVGDARSLGSRLCGDSQELSCGEAGGQVDEAQSGEGPDVMGEREDLRV